jgi:glyoxylase-like metal-dependent hydrolase (beta-lactamase superfamily II)
MFTRISHFDGTRDALRPMQRVDNAREAAKDFRRDMLAKPQVLFYKTFELVRVPYPSKFAYLNAFGLPTPFVHLCNRLFVIQFSSNEGVKTLLVSPSDWENQRATPFFAHLDAKAGPLAGVMEALVLKKTSTVLQCLASIGLRPEDVDYITYDHLHTQNVSRWLGANGQAPLFPNAKLLVMREEWESAQALIPWQNQWYCPQGTQGIAPERIELLDDSVWLGDGAVALVRTKGHTEGNHSIVAHTEQGLLVTSENGVSLDAYEPRHSKISGLADFAKRTGAEVIINGNTQEYVVDQYISMVQEKSMAGPNPADERFPNVVPSSEAQPYWLFPGTAPTMRSGNLEFGRFVVPA